MSVLDKTHKALKENGFVVQDGCAVGVVNEYLITIESIDGRRFNVFYYTSLNNEITKNTLKDIKFNFKENFGKKLLIQKLDNSVSTVFIFSKKFEDGNIMKYLNDITFALKDAQIYNEKKCYICLQDNVDSVFRNKKMMKNVHLKCAQQEIITDVELIESKKYNFFTGTLGAFLGLFLGILPSIVTIVAMETIYSILIMIVPFAIFMVYKYFNGKPGIYALILNVALSFVAVILMRYISVIDEVYSTFGVDIATTFELTNSVFLSLEGIIDVIETSVLEFIFMGLGILVNWKMIATTHNKIIINERNRISTIIPINMFESIIKETKDK